jgi:hypothetical protein
MDDAIDGAGLAAARQHAARGDAAWWLGRVEESIAAYELAYGGLLASGELPAAAGAAIAVAVNLALRGDDAPAAGWLQRASRLLADLPECPEQGYLRYLVEVEGALDGPDPAGVVAAARVVADLGRRLGVPTSSRPGPSARGASWSGRAGSPRAPRCSTRRWSPSSPASSLRTGPATRTAT